MITKLNNQFYQNIYHTIIKNPIQRIYGKIQIKLYFKKYTHGPIVVMPYF